jgi:hypothetical protein
VIDAARDLAWQPMANLPGSLRYFERRESAERLVGYLQAVRRLPADELELRFLVAAARRLAACSFSNRRGHAYYERRQAARELRGCLEVYDRLERP